MKKHIRYWIIAIILPALMFYSQIILAGPDNFTPGLFSTGSSDDVPIFPTKDFVTDGAEVIELTISFGDNVLVYGDPVLNLAAPPAPSVFLTQPDCDVATGTITVTAPIEDGMTYSIDGSTYTNTTGIFEGVLPGSYTVTAKNAVGEISDGTVAVINDQPPTPVVTDKFASINSGETFTVTPAGVPEGTTYTWTEPVYDGGVTGGVAQDEPQTSISGTLTIPSGEGTAVYTVTPTAGSCIGTAFTVTVTVTSTCEGVTISSHPTSDGICAVTGNASLTVGVTGTEPYVYQWRYYNGSSWSNVANGTPGGAVYTNATSSTLGISGITVDGSYQYHCYVTNCTGSKNATSNAATLLVNALPGVDAGVDQNIPFGTSTMLDATVTGTGTFTYSWEPAARLVNATIEDPETKNLSETTTFTLTATSLTTGCSNSDAIIINVSGSPLAVTTTADPATLCSGATVQLSAYATGGSGTYSYDWTSLPEGFTSSLANPTANPTVNTTYYVTVSDGYNTVNEEVAVTVNPLPDRPTITADGSTTFCKGGSVTLSSTEGSSYKWSTGATTRSILVAEGGNYTVQVTNEYGCLSEASTITVVTVNPLPSKPIITANGPLTFCENGSVTLTSQSSASEYLWSTGATTRSIDVSTTGTYSLRVTNTYGCLSDSSDPVDVTVNKLPDQPTILATGSTTFCDGGSVTLTSSPGVTYLWSTGATSQSINVKTSGNYTVQVTDINGCFSDPSAATAVIVNPLPSAPLAGLVTHPTCDIATGSVILSGLPEGDWIITPGEISGSTPDVTISGLSPGTYTFKVTNSLGCTSDASSEIVINTQPAVPSIPVVGTVTQPTCAVSTGSVGFSGLPSSGTWFLTRHPDGHITSDVGTTAVVNDIPAGTYTYTVRNSDGCISAPTEQVIIDPQPPIPPVPVQSTDCSGGFDHAVITVTSPTGEGYEYRLDEGSFQSGNVFTEIINSNHYVTVRNSYGCTTTGPTFNVNCGCVNPPDVTLSATGGSTCGVTPVTIEGNTFGGSATSVIITEDGGGIVSPSATTSSPFSFTYTPVASDAGKVVTITVTTDNPLGFPCSVETATYSLTVNANPAAPSVGAITHPTCSVATGSVVLSNLPSSGSWTLTVSPGGLTITGTGSTTTVEGLLTGTYSFTVTNALGCTSASSSNAVINSQPITPLPPAVGTITQPTCALSTGSVALSGLPDGAGQWIITRLPQGVTYTGTGTTRTITGLIAGTYTFTVTNSSNCVSEPSVPVVINSQPPTPQVPIIGTITQPTCAVATGTVILNGLPENGEWTLIRYPGGITSSGTGVTTTVSGLSTGTYNFAVTNAEGCTSAVSGNVVISTQPVTPGAPVVGTITHPTYSVPTGSVVLSGLPSSGTWTLTREPDGITLTGTGTTRTISGLNPGTYNFIVTNSVGCASLPSADVVINARPGSPTVIITNPPRICSNQTTDLTLPAVTVGSDPNLTYTYWTDTGATIPYETPTAAPPGVYYIKGTSTAGYYTIVPVVVTADELPVANAGHDQVLDYLFGTTLNADIPDTGTGLWDLVSGAGEIFNYAAPSTTVNGLALGENVFRWTVTNGVCPPVSDLVIIKVINLLIPTLITPNQDNRNDYFILRGLETLGRTELVIFDRRGLKVYENMDYDNSWEGLDYNSNPLPDDTYFYVLKAANGVSLSGYIVIRR